MTDAKSEATQKIKGTVELTHPVKFKRTLKILKNFGLLRQVPRKFNDDNGFFLSSGITFNILINMVPFIMLLLALLGRYVYNDQEVLDHITIYLKDMAPSFDPKIMSDLVGVIENLQVVGFLGFVGLLWFSTWLFSSVRIALNMVFQVEKNRGILWGIGIDLLMIFITGMLLLLSLILSSFVAFLQTYHGRIPVAMGPTIQWILKYLVPFFFSVSMFTLIYKIIPNKRVHFESALQTALFAGLLWEAAKHLFGWYVAHLAQYSVFYGSLSTMVIFVLWVYYSSAILVVGAEFAYLLEKDKCAGKAAV
ncbi:MAG: YihY/virulence factor BrkB family protein [Syntrophorhabdaceae bacterium]